MAYIRALVIFKGGGINILWAPFEPVSQGSKLPFRLQNRADGMEPE